MGSYGKDDKIGLRIRMFKTQNIVRIFVLDSWFVVPDSRRLSSPSMHSMLIKLMSIYTGRISLSVTQQDYVVSPPSPPPFADVLSTQHRTRIPPAVQPPSVQDTQLQRV